MFIDRPKFLHRCYYSDNILVDPTLRKIHEDTIVVKDKSESKISRLPDLSPGHCGLLVDLQCREEGFITVVVSFTIPYF